MQRRRGRGVKEAEGNGGRKFQISDFRFQISELRIENRELRIWSSEGLKGQVATELDHIAMAMWQSDGILADGTWTEWNWVIAGWFAICGFSYSEGIIYIACGKDSECAGVGPLGVIWLGDGQLTIDN